MGALPRGRRSAAQTSLTSRGLARYFKDLCNTELTFENWFGVFWIFKAGTREETG